MRQVPFPVLMTHDSSDCEPKARGFETPLVKAAAGENEFDGVKTRSCLRILFSFCFT
jgi:hypothetical protein